MWSNSARTSSLIDLLRYSAVRDQIVLGPQLHRALVASRVEIVDPLPSKCCCLDRPAIRSRLSEVLDRKLENDEHLFIMLFDLKRVPFFQLLRHGCHQLEFQTLR